MEKSKGSFSSTRSMVITALLIAISIIIPMYFSFFKIVIPPYFTATIAAHVPQFIAMFISPAVAVGVGIGSAAGFFLAGYGPVVALRATSHIVWGLIGAYLFMRDKKNITPGRIISILLITGVIHGLYEGLVIIPFLANKGTLTAAAIIVTAFGTFLHHLVDAAIALPVASALKLIPDHIFRMRKNR